MLTLENGQEREHVLGKFKTFFRSIGMMAPEPLPETEKTIKQRAVTRDRRQKTLDTFFSNVFAQVGIACLRERVVDFVSLLSPVSVRSMRSAILFYQFRPSVRLCFTL